MNLDNSNSLACALYLITPPKIKLDEFKEKLVDALKPGLVKSIQLRLKGVSEQDVIEAGKALKPICHRFNSTFIINDRPDLALKIGADGVHLGEEDVSIENARKILGNSFIIGASCYDSKHKAMLASEAGADYVAFGAFYDTNTKTPKSKASIDLIEDWSYTSSIACVAIGGIDASNCSEIVKAGADHIAVISSIWNDKEGSFLAVKKFNKILNI